jgi:photosystem II stability/assembly factor-like uncharacterized protein
MGNISNNYVPAQTAYSRVFLIEGRARPDHSAQYASSLKMTGLSQNFGDVTKIEMPDPQNYGKFLEVGSIRGAKERLTTSLVGRYAGSVKSALLRMARNGCPVDVQLHMGECQDPSIENDFSKAVILENVVLTTYSTEDLGALGTDENAKADETIEISASDAYEVTPMSFARKADDIVATQVLDVTVADSASCGTCGFESDGCKLVLAICKTPGGSASTPPDIIYSKDKGATWRAEDIDTITTALDPTGVAGVGKYAVVIAKAVTIYGIHYAFLSDFQNGIDPTFTRVSTGFVLPGVPNGISSFGRGAYIVGDWGYVYLTNDPTAGVSVLDAGSLTSSNLTCVHALNQDCALAGGNDGTILYTLNQTAWSQTASIPVGIGVNITTVYMKSKTEWWVGTSNGKLYYTTNSGGSWTQKVLPGTTQTKITDIKMPTPSVMFVAGIIAGPRGKLYRSFDGGNTFVVLPESIGSMPLADEFTALGSCAYDPDFIVAVGLHDNGSDGVIVVGNGQ